MFSFPSLCGLKTRCWLNVDQSGGQERPPKSQLRKELRTRRDFLRNTATLNQLSWGQAHVSSLHELLKSAFPSCKVAAEFWRRPWAAFVPMGSELQLLGHCPMEHCWLPHALPDGSMHWYNWQRDVEEWPKDSRSLPQPPSTVTLNPKLPRTSAPLLIFTPCLAVDRTGTRLGYGGGYYDRFLAAHKENSLTVACVPSELLLPANTLPKETHDVVVDLIITEKHTHIVSDRNFEAFKQKTLAAVNC